MAPEGGDRLRISLRLGTICAGRIQFHSSDAMISTPGCLDSQAPRQVRTLAAAGLIDHRYGRVRLVYDALSPKDQEKWRIEWKRDAEAALG